MELINTYKEFTYGNTAAFPLRSSMRGLAIWGLSLGRSIKHSNQWIRFPYYHHVFDDEKKDFGRQLKYLRNFGEFISIDQTYDFITGAVPLDGRYFCVSFDDGYRCLHSNMMEITAAMNVPVIIYLPTDYIGLSEENESDLKMIKDNLPGNPKLLSFLNWEQCREMLAHQISFGSHTKTHANLGKLTVAGVENELLLSQKIIEEKLAVPCVHFACPWGRTGIDFDPVITTPIAQKLGYKTFTTTTRGKTVAGDNVYTIKRDHLLAEWSNYQLRYFLSR